MPLNTTKDGIDKQHFVYQFIILEMQETMRLILPRLRKLQEVIRDCKKEAKVPPNEQFFERKVTEYLTLDKNDFKLELSEYHANERIKNIPLYIDEKTVEKLKNYFEAETNKSLGEKIKEFILERVIFDE